MKFKGMSVLVCAAALALTFGCGDSGSDSPGIFTTLASWVAGAAGIDPALIIAPAAPSSLNATVTSAFTADISWTDNSNNETGFKLMRQRGTGSWVMAANLGANVTAFTDPALKGAKTYNYRVMAFNTAGKSAWSNTISFTTPGLLPIASPSSVGGAATGSRSIHVTWTDASNNESGFRVEMETASVWSQIAQVGMGVTSYDATGLVPNSGYRFRVRAYNSAGLSDYGTSAIISTDPDTTPPSAPVLTATAATQTRINLSWTAATDDYQMSEYRVYREGSYLAATPLSTRNYADMSVPSPALDTCYIVDSRDTAGNLTPSNEACAYTTGLSSGFTVSTIMPFGGLITATDGQYFFVNVLHSSTAGGGAAAQLMDTHGKPVRSLSRADSGGGMNGIVWTGSKYLMAWSDDNLYTGKVMA